jgi:hypothetical protein
VAAMFVNGSGQISVHVTKQFQRRMFFFRNQPIRHNNFLWWPRLLMDQDKMSNISSGPSIDTSYQDSVHLAKRFRVEYFLEIDKSQTKIVCGGHICQSIKTK